MVDVRTHGPVQKHSISGGKNPLKSTTGQDRYTTVKALVSNNKAIEYKFDFTTRLNCRLKDLVEYLIAESDKILFVVRKVVCVESTDITTSYVNTSEFRNITKWMNCTNLHKAMPPLREAKVYKQWSAEIFLHWPVLHSPIISFFETLHTAWSPVQKSSKKYSDAKILICSKCLHPQEKYEQISVPGRHWSYALNRDSTLTSASVRIEEEA